MLKYKIFDYGSFKLLKLTSFPLRVNIKRSLNIWAIKKWKRWLQLTQGSWRDNGSRSCLILGLSEVIEVIDLNQPLYLTIKLTFKYVGIELFDHGCIRIK
ncbi:Hypothetical_protein [Hexamita inflata]|uniref:Hypothetical_protein n=1 Tax=Hexamita inflata TaxID=28002 RepID=A0AA86PF09_9EUKA|nr:Hypothetical protein HINF_LOCUS22224 [Hexamita inflata]